MTHLWCKSRIYTIVIEILFYEWGVSVEIEFKHKIEKLLIELKNKKPGNERAVIGLDGFVDEILHVVDKRINVNEYERLKTMKEYGERITKAAGLSTNVEMVVVQEKLGGNGPILSNALLTFGIGLTYMGALGYPHIEKVFEPMTEKCETFSIAKPGHTDAVEFEDGKIMVGKHYTLKDVNWSNIKKIIGITKLTELINGSKLLGLENWTMLPFMSEIWKGLIEEVLPQLDNSKGKRLAFFDLADPEKRTKEDILEALKLIGKFSEYFDVILGLNLKEAIEIAEVLELDIPKGSKDKIEFSELVGLVAKKIGLYCLVVHPTNEAGTVVDGCYYNVQGAYTPKPKLTTGAGDNFNAGFCLGQILGVTPEQSLILGVGTSGYYVRNAKSPNFQELMNFLEDWVMDRV